MRIVQLASEFAPIAKAGGLGEVVVGLSRELLRLGETVEVIIPKYDFIDVKKLVDIRLDLPDFKCVEHGNPHTNSMWTASCEDIRIHLLEVRHPSGYFHRGEIYGCKDDAARFLYFSKAALTYLKLIEKPIDILHLHDWHVAIAAVLARDQFNLPIKSIVLTIHNGEYQGKCAAWDLDAIGLKGTDYLVKEKLQDTDPKHPKLINLLKGGIVYADAVNTVSPTYTKEILTPEMGYGLESTFYKHKNKLTGILNGLDLQLWDPGYSKTDPIEKILQAKEAGRNRLRRQFSLSNTRRPWVGAITRLAVQKGPELLEEALIQTLRLGGVFLLLGSSPTSQLQAHFEAIGKKYSGTNQLLLHFAYDETLSREIYQALDFLVVPSRYEPCGLTQMIGMHYGTIPIARETGGLKDTIIDCKAEGPQTNANGFLFSKYCKTDLNEALERAIKLFFTHPQKINTLIANGIRKDWSWKHPAQVYLDWYRKQVETSRKSEQISQKVN